MVPGAGPATPIVAIALVMVGVIGTLLTSVIKVTVIVMALLAPPVALIALNLTFANVNVPVTPALLNARILVCLAAGVVEDCIVNAIDVTSTAGFTTLTIAGSYVNVISAMPIFPPAGAVTVIGTVNVPPTGTLKFVMLMLCAAAGKTSTSSSAE
jgi:hypothetical protein